MKNKPSEELKRRFGLRIKVNRLKTAFKRRESANNITAPMDPHAGRWKGHPDDDNQMNETEFERELEIPWKR
jgi:hypothetical protein